MITAPRWSEKEDEFLRNNYGTQTAHELAASLGRGYDATKKRATRLGLASVPADSWSEDEIEILRQEYGKISYQELIKKYGWNRTESSVEHKVSRLKLTEGYYHTVNHDFFAEPNLLNSYIAGFISADGCVLDSRASLIINLHEKDGEHLQKMSSFITDAPIIHKLIKNQKFGNYIFDCPQTKITISSKKLLNDLKNNFNMVARKTLIYEPPIHLTNENSLAFLIGNIDGDGSVSIREHKQVQGNNTYIYPTLTLKLLGTKSFLEWAKKVFGVYVDLTDVNVNQITNQKIYRFQISGKKAVEIFHILNKIDVPKMERKWSNPKLELVMD